MAATQKRYIRPTARLSGAPLDGEAAVCALRVAGRDDLRFAAAEVIERDTRGIRRRVVGAEQLLANEPDGDLRLLLDRLQQPRAPIAGLALDRLLIMGIVNVTPDSFSDGGRFLAADVAIEHALRLEAEGADILDIGGESTRPGSEGVSLDDEWARVGPVIAALAKRSKARLSVDTRKAEVMRRAATEGAHIINDVAALTHDPAAIEAAAATGMPVVLMHSRGDPRVMQQNPTYDDATLDISDWLEARVLECERAGIPRSRLVVDPGIGFGKTLAHNLELLAQLSLFHGLGCAVLLGASRKSFIGRASGDMAADRLPGSIAAALAGVAQGVQIVRVHDVAATRQALSVWQSAAANSSGASVMAPPN